MTLFYRGNNPIQEISLNFLIQRPAPVGSPFEDPPGNMKNLRRARDADKILHLPDFWLNFL
jgi:hypothetical protein